MNPNPSSPMGGAPAGANAQDALNIPSILLIVTGALGIVGSLMGMLGGSAMGNMGALAEKSPELARAMASMQGGAGMYVRALVGLAISGFIIFGAMQMRTMKNYGLAMGAAIVAMLPCGGCCCIGLPVGIWALVTMMKPEIKSQFQG